LYIENISHYEINMIDNNLCSSNKQEKIITSKKNFAQNINTFVLI